MYLAGRQTVSAAPVAAPTGAAAGSAIADFLVGFTSAQNVPGESDKNSSGNDQGNDGGEQETSREPHAVHHARSLRPLAETEREANDVEGQCGQQHSRSSHAERCKGMETKCSQQIACASG